MKHQEKNSKQILEQAVQELRAEQPGPEMSRDAGQRVWQRLSEDPAGAAVSSIRGCVDVRALLPQYRSGQLAEARKLLVEAHLHECVACRREADAEKPSPALQPWQHELPRASGRQFRWVMAAAAVVIIAVSAYSIQNWIFSGPPGMRAHVDSFDGGLYRVSFNGERPLKPGDELVEGERVRSGPASRAILHLRDGSTVEMNERAEFGVSMRRKDTTIELERGNIIVQAAKRREGHLYVAARDCRVSVTGTVFSVHSGMKGSRVSVIEGEVRVAHSGSTSILHPGDQLSTNAAVAAVPVQQEIAWSQDRDKHLALLAEFVHLEHKLEAVQMPDLRYQSKILPALPANTVLYASLPNLGNAAQQANQLFQQELEESQVLRDWWEQVQARRKGPSLTDVIAEVHAFGEYLGDEIVFSVALDGTRGAPLVVAPIQRPGLDQFIAGELARHGHAGDSRVHVVNEAQLNTVSGQSEKELFVLVRPDFVAASGNAAALQRFNAALNRGAGGFAGTPFGRRIDASYQRGVGMLFAADLETMAARRAAEYPSQHREQMMAQSGLADVQFLVAERKGSGEKTQNQAELTFTGPRRGFASWLAAPAPMGGLDFVSPDAGAAAAFVAKNPKDMLDDVLNIASVSNPNAEENLAKGESELKISFHQDLVDTLGGEVTLALDGPLLPNPSWKVIVEVNDSTRLQATIQQLVADANEHNNDQPEKHVSLEQSTANGLTYYTLNFQGAKLSEVDYTFADGYMIIAPSRALVMNAVNIHRSGNSLARSGNFKALLPQDEHADVSGLLYQNLAPVVGPVLQQLSPSQQQSFQQLAAESKPSVVCAYGEGNAIRVASNSRLFGLDLNTLALTGLLRLTQPRRAVRFD
ncbi:MAG TPA: FecR domain-containing protein [Candidatus Angelobacter sp.]|nr:FecR domain-containing protein [Candidatus Angelobacter sp.]